MSRLRITIDGPAASGKTTTAREVAKRLGYRYIDSGALYRAVALKVNRLGLEPGDLDAIEAALKTTEARYASDGTIILDGVPETDRLRSPRISGLASKLSVHRAVRAWVNRRLRVAAAAGGVVMEGRDIGTVVLPDAEVKVFLQAADSERARRRHEDLRRAGRTASVDAVREEILERDHRDASRSEAPLKAAEDAALIDGTDLTFEEQVEQVLALARARGA